MFQMRTLATGLTINKSGNVSRERNDPKATLLASCLKKNTSIYLDQYKQNLLWSFVDLCKADQSHAWKTVNNHWFVCLCSCTIAALETTSTSPLDQRSPPHLRRLHERRILMNSRDCVKPRQCKWPTLHMYNIHIYAYNIYSVCNIVMNFVVVCSRCVRFR